MTSTTSFFPPAATRAGTPAYSPDTAASLATSDSAETRSFEEMCSDHDPRDEAGFAASSDDLTEHAAACEDEARHPATSEAHGECAADAAECEEDDGQEEPSATVAVPALVSPSIIQTLLATLNAGTTPTIAAPNVKNGAAENAGTHVTHQMAMPSVRADGRGASAGIVDDAAVGAGVAGRQAPRAVPAPEGQAADARGDRRPTSAPAHLTARATAAETSTPTTSVAPGAGAAKAKTDPAEDATVAPAVARLLQAKGQVEKNAGRSPGEFMAESGPGQNKFLNADSQLLATSVRTAGTRTAISAGTMSSPSSTTQRPIESPVLATASSMTAGQGTWAETLSVDWKGWTNGGGERSSTAAQFSQLGDKLNHAGVIAGPATAAVARAATPAVAQAAPAAPVVPADAAEALAPIHSAIERLVLHGRDQLALTVRFEQGGSLSIKLAMHQGEIATQIQTDVPGLEAALKSAWGELAQDWNSRGWKLGHPEFTASTATYHQREDTTADSRGQGRQARQEAAEDPSFGGRAFTPARLKHTGAAVLSGLDALRAAAISRRGIHTWA